ncbi:hypothetical protein PR048_029159 [Dryococelus australis]|uniref:Uncharacterized protein n=1 Tax=Dryococelus australis TaxID=614101 RepID=A0ABQ9GF85_9NEOP|nr:hypothetical protein PR048_029159 [Dryococelus australis]
MVIDTCVQFREPCAGNEEASYRIDCSPPTKTNRVRFPAGSPPPLVCVNRTGNQQVISGDLSFPRPSIPALLHTRFTLIGSQDLDSTSRGAVGWCAVGLGCKRLWVRIPGKAWVLKLGHKIVCKPSPDKPSGITPGGVNKHFTNQSNSVLTSNNIGKKSNPALGHGDWLCAASVIALLHIHSTFASVKCQSLFRQPCAITLWLGGEIWMALIIEVVRADEDEVTSEQGAAPNARTRETGDLRENPPISGRRPARLPQANIRVRPLQESNSVRLSGRLGVLTTRPPRLSFHSSIGVRVITHHRPIGLYHAGYYPVLYSVRYWPVIDQWRAELILTQSNVLYPSVTAKAFVAADKQLVSLHGWEKFSMVRSAYPRMNEDIWADINIEVFRADEGEAKGVWNSIGMKGRGETGDLRENPPTSGIVRYDSRVRKIRGATPPRIEPGSPRWEGELSNHYTTAASYVNCL